MAAPVKRFQVGNVTIARFENDVDGPRGKFIAVSFKAQKFYQQNGTTKYTDSFKSNELPFVISALQEAWNDHYIKQQYEDSPEVTKPDTDNPVNW